MNFGFFLALTAIAVGFTAIFLINQLIRSERIALAEQIADSKKEAMDRVSEVEAEAAGPEVNSMDSDVERDYEGVG